MNGCLSTRRVTLCVLCVVCIAVTPPDFRPCSGMVNSHEVFILWFVLFYPLILFSLKNIFLFKFVFNVSLLAFWLLISLWSKIIMSFENSSCNELKKVFCLTFKSNNNETSLYVFCMLHIEEEGRRLIFKEL